MQNYFVDLEPIGEYVDVLGVKVRYCCSSTQIHRSMGLAWLGLVVGEHQDWINSDDGKRKKVERVLACSIYMVFVALVIATKSLR